MSLGTPGTLAVVHDFALLALGLLLVGSVAALVGARDLRRWPQAGPVVRGVLLAVFAVAFVSAGAWLSWFTGRPQPEPLQRKLYSQVSYERDVRQQPRPLVIHLVSVELGGNVRLLVTPGRPGSRQLAGQTTSSFLRRFKVQVAINGQIFYPWHTGLWDYYPRVGDPVNVVGLNASGAKIYAQPTPSHPTLYLSADGRASIGRRIGTVHHAISGTCLLLDDGEIGRRLRGGGLQPRTAVGLDREGRYALLVVVDGRQPNYSEGVSLRELAALMRGYGAYRAINLDGGGSSALAIQRPDGEPLLLNTPIDARIPGRERIVANHLGVYTTH